MRTPRRRARSEAGRTGLFWPWQRNLTVGGLTPTNNTGPSGDPKLIVPKQAPSPACIWAVQPSYVDGDLALHLIRPRLEAVQRAPGGGRSTADTVARIATLNPKPKTPNPRPEKLPRKLLLWPGSSALMRARSTFSGSRKFNKRFTCRWPIGHLGLTL